MKQAQNKGITLIALVITIIVLLILAAISIATLTGDNGILTKANEAKDETRGASVEEAKDLWKAEKEADKHTGITTAQTLDQLLEELKKQNLLTENELEKIKETGSVTIGKRTIVFGNEAQTLVEAFKAGEIKIGDYLDYKPVAGNETTVTKEETGYNEEQKYEVDTKTTWRVLGLDENETNLLLISGSPIKKSETSTEKPYLVLQGAESYYNCEDVLNKVSSIYKNNLAQEARSIKMEDITRTLGITIDKENNKAYKTEDPSKADLPFQGSFGQTYTYKSGYYAPENYLKATYLTNQKYQKLENKKAGDPVNGTAYMLLYTENAVVEQGSTVYDLLFKGTTSSENYAKSYWLASPGVIVDSVVAYFGPGYVYRGGARSGYALFYSNGRWRARELGVRPVISLQSGVSVDDIKVITGAESEWSTEAGEVDNGRVDKGIIE